MNAICPLCEKSQYSLLYDNPGGWLSQNGVAAKFYICEVCGLVARLPGVQTLEDFYQLEYWGERDLSPQRFLKLSPRHARKIRYLMETTGESFDGETILDLGCGFGHTSATLHQLLPKSQIIGVEPSLQLADCLTKYNQSPDMKFMAGSLETLGPAFRHKAKLIVLDSVFEHLTNPVQGLKLLREVLAPGGYLLIESPEVMEPGHFGLNYFFRDFHLFYYSLVTMRAMLNKCGFQMMAQTVGDPFRYISGDTQGAIARPQEPPPVIDPSTFVNPDEVKRIRSRIATESRKISGVATMVYRYKIRRPLLAWGARVRHLGRA